MSILIATATVARVVLGYRPFPSVDDFTYVPLGQATLHPELFPRDDILRGYVNHVPLWPVFLVLFERTLGLAGGLFLLTLLLTFLTVYLLRGLLRSLGATDFALPIVMVLALTVTIQGIGRGAFDGLLGNAFHMQWLALLLLLGAYRGFVRGTAMPTGAYLGAAAWVHPLVAFHGALCVLMAGLLRPARGIMQVAKIGLSAVVVALPVCFLLLRNILSSSQGDASLVGMSLPEILLFRAPHHYDLAGLPFLILALLGVLTLTARPALVKRERESANRLYGLLTGHAVLVALAFVFHGPLRSQDHPPSEFWIFALDLTRTSPLFMALAATAVAASVPRPDEAFNPPVWGPLRHRVLMCFALLALSFLFLINLRHSPWIFALLLLSAAAYVMSRRRGPLLLPTLGLFGVSLLASVAFLADSDLRAEPSTAEAEMFSWARGNTPLNALFIVPPGMQSFRLGAQRSVYVDFKSFPPSQPSLIREWRRRLEEVANPDTRALEQGHGWPGIAMWDAAYAKRNPPARIRDLLARTGADFFVLDLVLARAPPHLPSGNPHVEQRTGGRVGPLVVAYENSRYRVYRRPPDA